MLLQRGASINLQISGGATALMAAALYGHTTIVQVLLDAKADASLQGTNGYTALVYAEELKHTATVQLLRQHAEQQAAHIALKLSLSLTPNPSSRKNSDPYPMRKP